MAAGISLVVGGGHGGGFRALREVGARPRSDEERLADGAGNGGVRPGRIGLLAMPVPPAPTLSELFAPSPRDGGWAGLLLAQLGRGPLLWVQERMAILEGGRVYPPGLGDAARELIHVETRDARDALWAMEEGLRCGGLSAVIGEIWGDPASLSFTATRRLAVAAERHGVAAWLVRLGGAENLSGARMRWRVASAPSFTHPLNPRAPGAAAWECELFRARGAAPGRWTVADEPPPVSVPGPVSVSAAAARDRVSVAAAPGDRALGEGERRAS